VEFGVCTDKARKRKIEMNTILPTTLVGSYPQPDWLIDRAKLAGRFPPRDDKIRVNSSSLDHPLAILPGQGIEIVAIKKKVMVRAHDALGLLAEPRSERDGRGGLWSGDQVTAFQLCNGVYGA
jgi:hypothetical protein